MLLDHLIILLIIYMHVAKAGGLLIIYYSYINVLIQEYRNWIKLPYNLICVTRQNKENSYFKNSLQKNITIFTEMMQYSNGIIKYTIYNQV